MEWLTANWFWVVIGAAFIAMHMSATAVMGVMTVKDAAKKVKRAGVRGSVSTEMVANQEREILIIPMMVPEH